MVNQGTPEEKLFRSCKLTVESGEFVTVLGSNGAGKSTLSMLLPDR
ncbi:hemin importer ATP-binding subunit [Weissella viridescens]|uniref:Hemin importer ATP-binding subunit n=1 Tax=Weissella viridescens TaxID=1629 RepID=A0A380P8V8_WEIVI|nr:hemin importer ATP-binding subunit [Weissella viridescens]